jgi:hypothetical protein
MAKFEIDRAGMRKWEKQLAKDLEKVEKEANAAAATKDTPEAKAREFARVLKKHGVANVDEREIRGQFGGK